MAKLTITELDVLARTIYDRYWKEHPRTENAIKNIPEPKKTQCALLVDRYKTGIELENKGKQIKKDVISEINLITGGYLYVNDDKCEASICYEMYFKERNNNNITIDSIKDKLILKNLQGSIDVENIIEQIIKELTN